MPRRIEIQPGADDDIRRITGYIARRVSPRSAANWHVRIRATIGRLADDADQWPEAGEAGDVGIDLRCRLHGRRPHVYRILFTTDADVVYVHAVRHAAQAGLSAGDI